MPTIRLTKSAVDALPFEAKGQKIYRDDQLPSFGLVVGSKSKTYIVEARVGGKNARCTVGRDGVEDDQRVELGWTYGFGAGPTQTASVETQNTGAVRPVADVAMVSPANNRNGSIGTACLNTV